MVDVVGHLHVFVLDGFVGGLGTDGVRHEDQSSPVVAPVGGSSYFFGRIPRKRLNMLRIRHHWNKNAHAELWAFRKAVDEL